MVSSFAFAFGVLSVLAAVSAAPPPSPNFAVTTVAGNVASRSDRRPVSGGVYDPAAQQTFISWSGVDANAFVQAFDHRTSTWTQPKFLAEGKDDSHNYPTMVQAADGHLLIVRGLHNTATVIHRSPEPHSIDGDWTSDEVEQGRAASYPMPVSLADGRIIVFYRETVEELNKTAAIDFRPMKYIISEDNGLSWTNSVDLTGDAWAIGSKDRTDHMNEIYIGQLRYVPSTSRILITYTLAGGGPTQHKHDIYHRNQYFVSFDTSNLHFYSAAGVDLGTQVDDNDQETHLKIVETPVELPHGTKSPDYISNVGTQADGSPFVLWFQFDDSGLIHNYAGAFNSQTKKWDVREVATGFRFKDIESLGGGAWRVYVARDGKKNIETYILDNGGQTFTHETTIQTPKPVQRIEVISGFRDPARILATGDSTARAVSVADGDIYVAGSQ